MAFAPRKGRVQRRRMHVVVAALLACGCGDSTGPGEPVRTVVVSGLPAAPLLVGSTVQLVATPLSHSGAVLTNRQASWTTGDPGIATVSTGGAVTAVGAGTVAVTATVEGVGGTVSLDVRAGGSIGPHGGTLVLLGGAVTLVVAADALAQTTTILAWPAVAVPANPRRVGDTAYELGPEGLFFQQPAMLTLRYRLADVPDGVHGSTLQLYRRHGDAWTVVGGSVVDPAAGTVSGGITRAGTYAVLSTPVGRIDIADATAGAALYPGQTVQLAAAVFDDDNGVMPAAIATWSSSDPARATVDGTGRVTAHDAGAVIVTAGLAGKSAEMQLAVLPRVSPVWREVREWATFQGSPRRDGYVAATLDPLVFAQQWETTLAEGVPLNPVVIGEGRVYVSLHGDNLSRQRLFAVDASTGGLLWSHEFGPIHSVHPPAFGDGGVFVTTGGQQNSFLWGFEASTGAVRFRSPYGNQWSRWYAPAVIDRLLYMAGGYEGGLYAFSTVDGGKKWFVQTNFYDAWTPAVADGHVLAYTGMDSPQLTALDMLTGAEVYRIVDPDFVWNGWSMHTSPVVGSAGGAFVTQAGRLISFDLSNRSAGWTRYAEFRGTVAAAAGRVYVHNGSRVDARHESDGTLLWSWVPPVGRPERTMVVTDNLLFVTTVEDWGSASRTYAIDLATGKHVWSHPSGGELALGAQGLLLIAARNGRLTALSVR
jgi:hypothetical protein